MNHTITVPFIDDNGEQQEIRYARTSPRGKQIAEEMRRERMRKMERLTTAALAFGIIGTSQIFT